MKLSKETLTLLKNFSAINSNLLLKPGKTISTISAQKNVMADASIAEEIGQEFGIYDLNEFLGALSLFEDPELEFNDKFVKIKHAKNSVKFFSADPSVLAAPTKKINFPAAEIEFTIPAATLAMIQKTASVLSASDVSIVGDGTKISVVVGDKKNITGNSYEADVGEECDKVFCVNLKVENLKMLPGQYDVAIAARKISRFKATNSDLTYYVAIEADSSFEF